MTSALKWLAVIIPLLLLVMPTPGEAQPESLRVATRIIKPFVFEEGGNLTGFSIELWREIAIQLGIRTEYVIKPTLRDLLDATQNGEADVAIAAISITEERERSWDFSHPMFEAGLQILAPEQGGGGGGIASITGTLFSPRFLPALVFVIIGSVVAGHIVWFFERKRTDGFLSSPSYYPGIFEATFWATTALATQAEAWPKNAVSRVVSVIWMFMAVLFIAFFTAAVTSQLTVEHLRGDITGPDDLPGKRVNTVRNSTAARYLAERNVDPREFNTVDESIQSLERGEADAVVYDAPVLQYYASHEGKGKLQVVGSVFRRESYGIQFPKDSPLRKQVNEALLRLRENGAYDRLQTRWFGGEGGKASS
ncbi:MAG: Transporter substrate-binding protein [Chloroflexi bacterium]|nr:Transporter substrate-binding protein [Chloroflexota bacterium]